MKDKILMLIIGILIGAIITGGCFMILNGGRTSNNGNMPQGGKDMENFIPGERPDGMPGEPQNKSENNTSSENVTEQNNV